MKAVSIFLFLLFSLLTLQRARGSLVYSWILRVMALGALLVALWNPRFLRQTTALDLILAVDDSYSVGPEGRDEAIRILERAEKIDAGMTSIGLLLFGKRPVWEFFPTRDRSSSDLASPVERGETDIASALLAALARVEPEKEGRILLISDGNQNRGEVLGILPLLRSHGVQVWARPVGLTAGKNEVYAKELALPERVNAGETFEVRGEVESLSAASARVRLVHDGVIEGERAVRLRAGTNRISFETAPAHQGSHVYELMVESAGDTFPENNRLEGLVEVKGPPRILYIHSPVNREHLMARVSKAQGYLVREFRADGAPNSAAELTAFDAVILDNVAAHRLPRAGIEAMERYVRDLGGGLIVVGGTESYGAGGYDKTPLERIVPLEMRPGSQRNFPEVALLFVVDTSESMAGGSKGSTKLDLAKSAAVAAAELLKPFDEVGILAFDAAWNWALPFRQVGRGERVSRRILSLSSQGGTDLYKAMLEAQRSISAREAGIRHVVVISDGLTDKRDFHTLVTRMAQKGITVSAVAVGEDANGALMAEIARDGKGRLYRTSDLNDIPKIFTTETLLASRDLLVEKPVQPVIVGQGGPLGGFSAERIPPLRGYVLTQAKPHTEILMKVEQNPLLASWRYGLGKVIAFTSDLSGRWGRDWVSWGDFPRWAGQVVRYAMRRTSESKIVTQFVRDGEEIRTRVDLFSKEGIPLNHVSLKGIVTTPDNGTSRIPFEQTASGRYEAAFRAASKGIYLLTLYQEGQTVPLATVPFASPYPAEYRQIGADDSMLNRISAETGGEVIRNDKIDEGLKRLITPRESASVLAKSTWWPASLAALLFFLTDLGLRRFRVRSEGSADTQAS